MCGIFGIYLSNVSKHAYPYIVSGITVLQHRGQDAAGIHTCHEKQIHKYKNVGKVEEVFKIDKSDILLGNYGIGHVRYCTAGSLNIDHAQPLHTNIPFGISLVHNGNLTNTQELIDVLKQNGVYVDSCSDSELLLQIFALALQFNIYTHGITTNTVIEAVKSVMKLCKGSYSVIVMIRGFGLVVFRDPRGIRPLCFGKTFSNDYAFASESVAIQSIGYEFIRDVNAGECVILTELSGLSTYMIKSVKSKPCLFEYIYFARPESVIDGILVYQARKNMGDALANKIMRDYPHIIDMIDVVMPVPDSARISALRTSYVLQKPYCEGLIKNNYIGRTFIMPSQKERTKSIKMKLNTIDQEFRGKSVLIIDDSIVRGNTSIQIIRLIKNAGAKRILFASIAPPVKYPNVYGIAIPTSDELIAYEKQNKDICQILGADELIYNDLQDVIDACSKINPVICEFETSCFTFTSILQNLK